MSVLRSLAIMAELALTYHKVTAVLVLLDIPVLIVKKNDLIVEMILALLAPCVKMSLVIITLLVFAVAGIQALIVT